LEKGKKKMHPDRSGIVQVNLSQGPSRTAVSGTGPIFVTACLCWEAEAPTRYVTIPWLGELQVTGFQANLLKGVNFLVGVAINAFALDLKIYFPARRVIGPSSVLSALQVS
jgi:hypothetical protein